MNGGWASEGEKNHETLGTLGNKQGFRGRKGGEWVSLVMGSEEDMDCMEH